MTCSSIGDTEPTTDDGRAHGLEAELAQVRAERDAALARLDDREQSIERIGGVARRATVVILIAPTAILIPLTVTSPGRTARC